ncbi:MAG: T9SS type A sorting domain-containing protein [Bacteroidales bacterium]|nr:T9SS type A sorting domain-containing protein [Bacteroidales bacterium]
MTSTEVIRSAQVVNLMGQAVMNLRGNGTTLSIDLSHVPAGVYFVRVDTGAGIQVKKLVRK